MKTSATLFVVDGANFFNGASRFLSEAYPSKVALRKEYMREWFDFDRLIRATVPPSDLNTWTGLGTVIFHSNKAVGKNERGDDPTGSGLSGGEESIRFWMRQGSANNTSTMLVDVPGARKGKETGVDISIVVHLFETMKQWDATVLFTEDADLTPAVWSLRRRGKRVYCSFSAQNVTDAPKPLVQASQHFYPWDLDFLKMDLDVFEFLNQGLPAFLRTPEGQLYKPQPIFGLHEIVLAPQSKGQVARLDRCAEVLGKCTDLQAVTDGGGSSNLYVKINTHRSDLVAEGALRHFAELSINQALAALSEAGGSELLAPKTGRGATRRQRR